MHFGAFNDEPWCLDYTCEKINSAKWIGYISKIHAYGVKKNFFDAPDFHYGTILIDEFALLHFCSRFLQKNLSSFKTGIKNNFI